MDFGVAIFPAHDAISPAEVARLAEQRGSDWNREEMANHAPEGILGRCGGVRRLLTARL